MGYHTVTIDSQDCFLGCKLGQLICRTKDGEKSVPLEDVASILVTGFSGTVHSELLLECAERGVPLIFCRSFRPTALVYPSNRSTDTFLTRALLGLGRKEKLILWESTVTAKCGNQWITARSFSDDEATLRQMEETSFGRHPQKEGTVARHFWKLWGRSLQMPEFRRVRSMTGVNQMLNYGYAVLLSSILQKLFAVGIDPSIGISHVVRERSDPLAYDLMEPYRVLVDRRVAAWIRQREGKDLIIDKEFRSFIAAFLKEKIAYEHLNIDAISCMESVVRSFRRAVVEEKTGLYRPWILKH